MSPLKIGQPVRVKGYPGIVGTFRGYAFAGFCAVQLPDGPRPITVQLADVDPMPEPARFFSLTAED